MNVLEIGAGTGYNAALLAELTGPSGAVSTIDIQAGVAADARRSLRRAGYRDVHVVRTDGARGLRSAAPFDRLIVTAGCWEIPREWLRQLRDGGILVLPLRINLAQVVVAFRKRGDTLATVSAAPGGFMPMEGRAGRRTRRRFGGPHTSLFLSHDYRGRRLREGVLIDLLRTPPRRINMPGLRQVARFPSSADFWVYLALHGLPVVGIGDGMNSQPDAGIADTVEGSLCLLATPGVVRGEAVVYGSSHAPDLLGQHLARWRAEGRPSVTRLRMVVEASNNARLSEIPRPLGEGAYEFGRDGRRFVAWYE
jgi:SAM-dependent methyltransferase